MPGNKMNLNASEFKEYDNMSDSSDVKHNSLELFLHYSKEKDIPERNDTIQDAFNRMKIQSCDDGERALYWKQQQNIISIEDFEEDQILCGYAEADLKSDIISEINLLQTLISNNTLEQVSQLESVFFPKIIGNWDKLVGFFQDADHRDRLTLSFSDILKELNLTIDGFGELVDYTLSDSVVDIDVAGWDILA